MVRRASPRGRSKHCRPRTRLKPLAVVCASKPTFHWPKVVPVPGLASRCLGRSVRRLSLRRPVAGWVRVWQRTPQPHRQESLLVARARSSRHARWNSYISPCLCMFFARRWQKNARPRTMVYCDENLQKAAERSRQQTRLGIFWLVLVAPLFTGTSILISKGKNHQVSCMSRQTDQPPQVEAHPPPRENLFIRNKA